MAKEAKLQAIHKMRVSVKSLDETFDRLGNEYDNALPSEQKRVAAQMGRVLDEKTSEGIFLNHLEAAATEVESPTALSYTELDAALAKLDQMKKTTGQLQKILQLASAIVDHASENRVEVSKRTT